MSSDQTSAKPRSSKCRRFCFSFDLHNYCPTCRESGKGDDLCVTNQGPCKICQDLSSEQHDKIKHRRRYTRKVKPDQNTSKDDLDLLGDDEAGSQADLEGAADTLFSSPPRPQPLRFESLSLKTPHNVPPAPGTALQNKIENNLQKSLGTTLNIQLKQEMGVFQASMLDAMKSLRDEMLALKNKSDVDKTSDPTQANTRPGPSTRTSDPIHSDPSEVQPMDLEPYGPSLPPRSTQKPQPERGVHSDLHSEHSEHSDQASDSEYYQARPKHKKHADRKKYKSKPIHKSKSSAEEDESSAPSRGFTHPKPKAPPEPQPQASSDPVFREVDMSDLPSQYTEEIETFRQLLDLPDPRETMPRSSTTVLGLDDEKGQQELRPRGPSAMLPLSPFLKDAFEKFEQDFLASNLPEGKYIKPPASTAKYYKVGQPCFEDKLQELNSDFAKICIRPNPLGPLLPNFPFIFLKNLSNSLDKTSPLSTSLLLLPGLLLHTTLFWKRAFPVSGLLTGRPKTKFWMELTLGSSLSVVIRTHVIILTLWRKGFSFNKGP